MRSIAQSEMTGAIARVLIIICSPILLGLGSWNLITTAALDTRLGRIEQWQRDVGKNLYPLDVARADFAFRDSQLASLKDSYANLDGRVSYLERSRSK